FFEDDILWLVQSGSAAEFELTAAKASVTVKGDSSDGYYKEQMPRYAVIVDGKTVFDAVTDRKDVNVSIIDSDNEKTVTVKIIHLSEANSGAVGIAGFDIVSSAETPVRPLPQKKYSIEFIGDSITCAYGVESENELEMFTTLTENFMKSYAYIAAEKLDADYSAVCYSGFGIISAYSDTGIKDTSRLVPDNYLFTSNQPECRKPWDFDIRKHNAVLVYLGTNDTNYVGKSEERMNEFSDGYFRFLETVREKNPNAYILCTIGTMQHGNIYPAIENAVSRFKKENGEKISCFLLPEQQSTDGFGSDWHPSAVTQRKCAELVAAELKKVLEH
ncbi:MAG: hypothetical protein J6Y93_03650, partial [Treponema sp.]|nr:hypothetical protein [Treponema sp.]